MKEKPKELAALDREVMEWLERIKANPALYHSDEFRTWAKQNVSRLLGWAEKSHAEEPNTSD